MVWFKYNYKNSILKWSTHYLCISIVLCRYEVLIIYSLRLCIKYLYITLVFCRFEVQFICSLRWSYVVTVQFISTLRLFYDIAKYTLFVYCVCLMPLRSEHYLYYVWLMTLQSSHYVSFTLVLRWSYIVTKGTLCVLCFGLMSLQSAHYASFTLVLCRYKVHIIWMLCLSYVVTKFTLFERYVCLMLLHISCTLGFSYIVTKYKLFVRCRYEVHIIYSLCLSVVVWSIIRLTSINVQKRVHRGRDRMVVGFTTTYTISAYHHWCCGFESRSGRGVQHYMW